MTPAENADSAIDERWAQRPDWAAASAQLTWVKKPNSDLALSWGDRLSATRFNLGYNAVDRHIIQGRIDEPALVMVDGDDGPVTVDTYARLVEHAGQFSGVLQALDAGPGDSLLVVMPVRRAGIVSFLGALRLGVTIDFADPTRVTAPALRALIEQVKPHVIVTMSEAGPQETAPTDLVAEALEGASSHPVRTVVIGPEAGADLAEGELAWSEVMKAGVVQPAGWRPLDGRASYRQQPTDQAWPVWSATLAAALLSQAAVSEPAGDTQAWCWAHGGDWDQACVMGVLLPLLSGSPAVVAPGPVAKLSERTRRELQATLGLPLHQPQQQDYWPLRP